MENEPNKEKPERLHSNLKRTQQLDPDPDSDDEDEPEAQPGPGLSSSSLVKSHSTDSLTTADTFDINNNNNNKAAFKDSINSLLAITSPSPNIHSGFSTPPAGDIAYKLRRSTSNVLTTEGSGGADPHKSEKSRRGSSRIKDVFYRKFPIHPDSITVYILSHVPFFTKTTKPGQHEQSKVKFAPDVVLQADAKGDVAGKERFVPRASQKRAKTFKNVVDDSGKIIYNPETSNVDQETDVESDYCEDCDCYTLYDLVCRRKYPESLPKNKPISLNYRVQVENFMDSLDTAGYYFEGNLKTITGAAELFQMPINKNPMTMNLNHLASKVWLFTYSIPSLFSSSESPTQREFQEVMDLFQNLGNKCQRACTDLNSFHSTFTDFENRVLKQLSRITSRLKVRLNWESIRRIQGYPISQRAVLRVSPGNNNNKSNHRAGSPCDVLINGEWNPLDKWGKFRTYPFHFRLKSLTSLLDDVLRGVQVIRSQLRFLQEDLDSGKFELDDKHVLTILGLMDGVIKFFVRSAETTAVHERNLKQVMRQFSKDIIEFLRLTHWTIWKLLELRDTIQLCFVFICSEFKKLAKFTKYKPSKIYQLANPNRLFCGICYNRFRLLSFRFQAEDFHRADFCRLLQMFYVNSNSCQFLLVRQLKPRHSSTPTLSAYRFARVEAEDDEETEEFIRQVFSHGSYHLRNSNSIEGSSEVEVVNNSGTDHTSSTTRSTDSAGRIRSSYVIS